MKERDNWTVFFIYSLVIVFCWITYIYTNLANQRDEWKRLALSYSDRYNEVSEQNLQLLDELNEYIIYDRFIKDLRQHK